MIRLPSSSLIALSLFAACTSYGATDSPVTVENAVEVPELLGHWLAIDSTFVGLSESTAPDTLCISVERRDSPGPDPTYTIRRFAGANCESEEWRFEAAFAEFGGETIASLRTELETGSVANVMRLYDFYRVRTLADSVIVTAIDADSLIAHLTEHPTLLPHVLLEGDPDLLLTARSDQLADFLAEHARTPSLWADSFAVVFHRRR